MIINQDTILLDNHCELRTKCTEVPLPMSKEDIETLTSMINYVRDSHDEEKQKSQNLRAAVGIAAPQIGVTKQMIAICIQGNEDTPDTEFALVNPKIISNSQQIAYLRNGESCLSVNPDHNGIVPRFARITVTGYDLLQKKQITVRLRNYKAIVLQHEIDHLSGVLYYDHIDSANPDQEIPDAIVIG